MILLPASLENISSRRDRTYKLVFGTPELSPEQLAEIGRAVNNEVFLAVKTDPFKTEEKEMLENLESDFEDTGKTPSQRLRGVFFILWKQKNEGYEMFDDYYRHKIEKVIEHYKSKIE